VQKCVVDCSPITPSGIEIHLTTENVKEKNLENKKVLGW